MTINKKFYLLYPPISKKERYSSDLGNSGGEQIPLGIYCIASYLRENGYEVKVVDAEAQKLNSKDILKQIKKFKPSFVGISSTTVAFHRALEIAKIIKKKENKICTIIGGPHVTSNPNHAMKFKEFDFGVLNEGEETIIELLDAIINKKEIKNIQGITFRNNKKIVVTERRPYIKDLDKLPLPAYDLIPDIGLYAPPPSNYKALPLISFNTSRGCPYQCTFCDKNVFGSIFRELSAEKVVEQLKYLWNKFHFREVAFMDDTFMINRKRLYKIFELLEKENISFYWTCMCRVNVVDYELLKYVKSKGCWHIAFGVESADSEILKIIKKGITIEQVRNAITWCRKVGIKTKGFFIIGHPGETIDTLNKTIKFACDLELDDIVATINTPIPGSPQYYFIKKYGSFDETDWSQFNYWRPVFVPFGLTKELLLKKQKEMYSKFYLRPRILFRYFVSFFGSGGFRRFVSLVKTSLYLFKKV